MKKTSLFCAALVIVLAGCGQKGPLYLPQPAKPKAESAKPAPVPSAAPEAKQESTGH
jgi:predicted small lipoprotein YifL